MAGIIADKQSKELPTDESMKAMRWQDLYSLRLSNRGDQNAQIKIAPFEHQAYARETVAENPLTAPVWAVMPAAYQAYKVLGGGEHDDMSTPASWDQATAGVKGVGQGISEAVKNLFK